MKICRYPDIPVGEVKYIPDMDVLIHNIKNSELEGKDKEIERLHSIIKEVRELLKRYQNNEYYYKYNGKYLKSEIKEDILEILDKEINDE